MTKQQAITIFKLIFVIACVAGLYFLTTYRSSELHENSAFTTGKVINTSGVAVKSGGMKIIEYEYEVDGIFIPVPVPLLALASAK